MGVHNRSNGEYCQRLIVDLLSVISIVLLTFVGVCTSKVPVECRRSSLGFDYTGQKNTTVSGRTCQSWSAQYPHQHTYTDPRRFPDDTLEDAGNFCRNPPPAATPLSGLWCLTTDPLVEYENCDVPACSEHPECRLTDAGTEYQGHISQTQTGTDCISWTLVPGGSASDVNYCRNPTSKPEGPWCYTSVDTWDYCAVPFCKPSAYCRRTAQGREYIGTVSATSNGVPCQRWDSQYPHEHGFQDPADFPDASVSDAADYCRNPDGRDEGPWCYTRDPEVEQESCDVPICQDCKISDNGVEYNGVLSVTETLKPCLQWASLQSAEAARLLNPDRFPDASVADAATFCRNPDRKPGGPWCFWGDDPMSWEYCSIPKCGGKEEETFKPRRARHVLHIGIDGLHPCFVNSTLGAPNIMNRIAAAGTYTLTRGRTVIQTVSAPSWTAITCGLNSETSGVTGNSWQPPWMGFKELITPSTGPSVAFPCIWQQIKSQDSTVRTATFTNWDWFWYVTSMGLPNAIDFDYYCDNYATCDPELVSRAADYLNRTLIGSTAESSYTFVYIGNVDEFGHTYGWCTPKYMEEVDIADQLVGQLLDVVDASGLADTDVTVMLSSDHGGHLRGHGAETDSDIVIPAFVRGPGIRRGVEFRHEVSNVDYVPTAMEMLGLKPSPWWKGHVLWEAFESTSAVSIDDLIDYDSG